MFYKDAYHQYQLGGSGGFPEKFDLVYTKTNETFGVKKGCKRRPSPPSTTKNDLASIKRENRQASKWYLWHPDFGDFEIHACGIISFNGQFVDHRF